MKRLDEGMGRLAAEHEQCGAPFAVEQAVLAEFDRVRRRKLVRRWIAATGAVAASVAAVWLGETRPGQQPVAPPVLVAQAEAEQPFVPIPYVLPPAPDERLEVVRMRMPVAALIADGFRMQTADMGAQAEADVIVGQDGRARAVRLISISSLN
jgi:hypothetical protein